MGENDNGTITSGIAAMLHASIGTDVRIGRARKNQQVGEIEWSPISHFNPIEHEIEHIGVNKEFRGQGIARLLYDQLLSNSQGKQFSGALIPQTERAWGKGKHASVETIFPHIYRARRLKPHLLNAGKARLQRITINYPSNNLKN